MHIRRFSIRAAAAATLATVALVLAAPAGPAFGGTYKSAPSPYTISIDSVTPSYASASPTRIKVSGTLTNHSGASATGLSVQMQTTLSAFVTPSAMSDYRTGTAFVESQAGNAYQVPGSVANGATVRWTATFTSASAGFSKFGVYGLEADALTSSQTTAGADRTYLPYWPGSGSADRLKIAWVWPLIDSPHQGACSGNLTDNSLEESLSQSGRLETLLSAGIAHQADTKLTWAVDPALLSDAKVMTGSYTTGGSAACSGASHHASSSAKQWLNQLTSDTATAGMFITPYADVDVSALTHAGLESDLRTAYSLGQSAAGPIMQRSFDSIGWPADGVADQSVLTDMARTGHVSTVLLNDSEMRLTGNSFADDAVASTTTGTGQKLKVLLTDQRLTSILSGSSGRTAASQFEVTQEFLAETAMVASEAPSIARSVVVAPPRNWNPSASVANDLLKLTSSTPWLRSASLSQLASSTPPAGETRAQPTDRQLPSNELSHAYIAKVTDARTSVNLLTSLLAHPGALSVQRLQSAVAATQSSAWRGGGEAGGLQALQALSGFARDVPEKKIGIFKTVKETLAGPSGKLPVSVYNKLDEPIRVRVAVTDSPRLSITVPTEPFIVPPKGTGTIELSVHSAQMGTTIVRLQLVTEDGSPLPWATENVSVVSTRYGRAVLVLIVAALGIVVLTSATRWIRKSMANGGAAGTGGDDQ